jgi:hypothetical protein
LSVAKLVLLSILNFFFIMAKINQHYQKLSAGYLFPEIARRTNQFLNENPGVQVMRLGIGDTTEPIVPSVLTGLRQGVDDLGNVGMDLRKVLRHYAKRLQNFIMSLVRQ